MRKNLKRKYTAVSYTVGRNQIVRSEIFSLLVIMYRIGSRWPGRRKNTNILKMNLSCVEPSLRGPTEGCSEYRWPFFFPFGKPDLNWTQHSTGNAHFKFIVMTMNFYRYSKICVCSHFACLKMSSWLKIYILHVTRSASTREIFVSKETFFFIVNARTNSFSTRSRGFNIPKYHQVLRAI